MKIKNRKLNIIIIPLALVLNTIICLIIGGYNLLIISTVYLILLGLPFYLSLRLEFNSIKFFCGYIFICLMIGIPNFFANQKISSFTIGLDWFDYSIKESIPPAFYISLFLFISIIFTLVIQKFIVLKKLNNQKIIFKRKYSIRSPYLIYLILLIIPMIFLNLWMFKNNIAMPGVEQRELPFKLNGILYYLVRIVTPILTLYFYSKTNKNFFITLTIIFFGIFTSLVSMSRLPGALIISGICYFTYINKNYILLFLSTLSLGVSYIFSSLMRQFYQIKSDYGNIFLFNEFSIFDFITKINDLDTSILSTFFSGIINTMLRIESFRSIIQASNYDLNNVTGVDGPNIILRLFLETKFDLDEHHFEWQGYIMRKGLYHGPSLFGDVIILTKENNWLIWLITFSFLSVLWITISEYLIKRLLIKFQINADANLFIIFSTAFFIIFRGYVLMQYYLFFLLLLNFLPNIKKKSYLKQNKYESL